MMKQYQLITYRQWQDLQQIAPESPLSTYHGFYELKKTLLEASGFKAVKYRYSHEMDEIIQSIVEQQEWCKHLYPTLEKLGLYYGRNTYNHDDAKFSAAIKEALISQRAILLEKPVNHNSGMLPPQTNFLKLPDNKTPRKLTPDEEKAQKMAFYVDDNYIEFTVHDLPNQPFTIFDSASQKMIEQGALDSSGYAYVKLAPNVKYVDVVFDKQQMIRPWYYDMPLQLLSGVRDAAQSTLDLAWSASTWLPSSPLFFSRIYDTVVNDKSIFTNDNPIQLPKVAKAETVSGAISHGVSQFLVGFIPVARQLKYIAPLKKMGSLGRGMIAGGVADFTVFAPGEERLSNLIQSFPELQNPVAEYLKASPDDSAAEGRLKNALEGLILGALVEPLARSLRALKYVRIKRTAFEVKTKVHYKIEIITIETESGGKSNWNKALNNPEPNKIYMVDGNKAYHTDNIGRLKCVDAELKLDTLDRNTYQQLKVGQQGIEGDEGGHLIASILNGSGEKINLLPMNANLNRGAWKQMENTWTKALEEGKTVNVKIEPVYSGTNIRPDKFMVKYTVDNGRSIEKVLINSVGGI